jgi:hypothetical protein
MHFINKKSFHLKISQNSELLIQYSEILSYFEILLIFFLIKIHNIVLIC